MALPHPDQSGSLIYLNNFTGCKVSNPGIAYEVFKPFEVEAVEVPVLHVLCTQASVELDGVGVPVEYRPFKAPAATPQGFLSAMVEKRVADATRAVFGQDEEVFEI